MRILLGIVSLLVFLFALLGWLTATALPQQIMAGIFFIVSAILFSAAAILTEIILFKKETLKEMKEQGHKIRIRIKNPQGEEDKHEWADVIEKKDK